MATAKPSLLTYHCHSSAILWVLCRNIHGVVLYNADVKQTINREPNNTAMPANSHPQDNRRPGQPRLAILDTRHPCVHVSRTRKYTQNRASIYKAINVISVQTLWRENEAKTVYTTVGQVSEQGYRKRAKQTIRRFHQLLNDALAIGRYIDREVAKGRRPSAILHINDLPEDDRFAEGDWDHIRLPVLFESYDLVDPEFQPATTRGEPEAVAVALQGADLRLPRKPVALNGHHLKFKARELREGTYYLPTGICRLRHGWRLFIRHSKGVWSDEIEDQPGHDPDSSLSEAWIYFVSQLRVLIPPAEPLAPISLQRCYTGIEGGTFLIGYRNGWRFQLRYNQKDGLERRHGVTVRTWREDTLTNANVRQALRHLAAMDNYRHHLNGTSGSSDTIITPETSIPLEFWPAEPVIPLAADDLLYEVEQRLPRPPQWTAQGDFRPPQRTAACT